MKTTGIILIVVAILVVTATAYHNSRKRQVPVVFSPKEMITALWNSYKSAYIESSSGRTIDRQQGNVTTSEGESYALLRSVWMDDKETFDRSWGWTKTFLRRPGDHLFSWLYGKHPDGSFGVLTEKGGDNAASDADTDIALALLFAYSRWGQTDYLVSAREIIRDIWRNEVVDIKGRPYLAANNLEKKYSREAIVVNPSYFAPYAYRVFAELDPQDNWEGLIDTSYAVLQASAAASAGASPSAGLPPNWALVNRSTAVIRPATAEGLTADYGFDALRVPWRIALDWRWYGEARARTTLASFAALEREWRSKGIIYGGYSHDGQATVPFEAPAMYGGSIGYFLVADPRNASEVYEQKLRALYDPDTSSWKRELSYYDDNWAWFGVALYHDLLPNLLPAVGTYRSNSPFVRETRIP